MTIPRASYAEVGAAVRALVRKANTADPRLSSAEYKVVLATVGLISSWSRLSDRVTIAAVAEMADLHPNKAGAALRSLAGRDLLTWVPSRARGASVLGLRPAYESVDLFADQSNPPGGATETLQSNPPEGPTGTPVQEGQSNPPGGATSPPPRGVVSREASENYPPSPPAGTQRSLLVHAVPEVVEIRKDDTTPHAAALALLVGLPAPLTPSRAAAIALAPAVAEHLDGGWPAATLAARLTADPPIGHIKSVRALLGYRLEELPVEFTGPKPVARRSVRDVFDGACSDCHGGKTVDDPANPGKVRPCPACVPAHAASA